MTAKPVVIILTRNEEARLGPCLDSLKDIGTEIFVVDSFSDDGTLDMLRARGISFVQRKFTNYAEQRNWAQANAPAGSEWVLHLDADERISPEFTRWLSHEYPGAALRADGFMFSRRTVFMGRWIKHGGHYPAYHLRLFKGRLGHCENKAYDQHFVVAGKVETIGGVDIIDTVADSLSQFISSHNRWSTVEAQECAGKAGGGEVKEDASGNPIERRRWLKNNMYLRLPPLVRPFLYFTYRYFVRLGFLDGAEGLIFHVLQGFWFRFLVDAKISEIRRSQAIERL